MSLNKLAVDSVDVSGKRVLIRFVFLCLYIVSVEKLQSFLVTLLIFCRSALTLAFEALVSLYYCILSSSQVLI